MKKILYIFGLLLLTNTLLNGAVKIHPKYTKILTSGSLLFVKIDNSRLPKEHHQALEYVVTKRTNIADLANTFSNSVQGFDFAGICEPDVSEIKVYLHNVGIGRATVTSDWQETKVYKFASGRRLYPEKVKRFSCSVPIHIDNGLLDVSFDNGKTYTKLPYYTVHITDIEVDIQSGFDSSVFNFQDYGWPEERTVSDGFYQ